MRALITLPFLLWLSGCAETDPYLKPGAWQPTGANAINLAAMVQRPGDLVRGRGARGSLAAEAAPPVERLIAGKVTPLPGTSSQTGASGPASPAPPSGAN